MITGREISERLIRAAEISRVSYTGTGPKMPTKAAWIDYQYTQADKNGWGAERLAEDRKDFFKRKPPTPQEISEAEEAQGWVAFVKDENERRCLSAWVWCSVTKGFFKDWCRAQSIHPETGRRRKERAILRILLRLEGKPLQHNDNDVSDLLPDDPVLGHKQVNIGNDAPNERYWRPDEAVPTCTFDERLMDFSWAEKQNAARRQREAKRREQAA